MLQLKFPKSVFQINRGDFIMLDNEYKKITKAVKQGNECTMTLNDEEEFTINDDVLDQYEFAIFEDPSGAIGVDVYYNCKLCNNPSVAFETVKQAEEHAERCLFNSQSKSCVLCKNLKIIEYPPYPRFAKEYKSIETYHAFGAYKQPYCMKKEKNIDERELFGDHTDCFEFTEEPAVVESTPEFDKYWELIMSDDIESREITKEELIEMIQNAEDDEAS